MLVLNLSCIKFEDHTVSGNVTKSWKAHYNHPYMNFTEVPLMVRDRWFTEFKRTYTWRPEFDAKARREFDKKAGDRLRVTLNQIFKMALHKQVSFMTDTVRAEFINKRKHPDFLKRSNQARDNRLSCQTLEKFDLAIAKYGIMRNYSTWLFHGESLDRPFISNFSESMVENENPTHMDMRQLVHDIYDHRDDDPNIGDNMDEGLPGPNKEAQSFYVLLKDAEEELWLGCKLTKLSFGKACPCCNFETNSQWLDDGHKYCYMGDHRFLGENHPFRWNKDNFNDKEEFRGAPLMLIGAEEFQKIKEMEDFEGSRFDHIFNLVSRDMNDASMVDTSNNIEYDFSVFSQVGKPLGKPITHTIIQMDKLQAQRYVLFNCPDVTEFLQVQGAELKRRSRPRRLTLNAIERLQHDIS
uniref:Uncharacterized protein n=1 Tax=Chenopodium quinoa TaxID=63459 RepID=A0A803MXX6_CHEQI